MLQVAEREFLWLDSMCWCVVQLDSLKKDLKLVRLTLERDGSVLHHNPSTSATNNNNNTVMTGSKESAGDVASAARDDHCTLADLSVNDDSSSVEMRTTTPTSPVTRSVKRRSTVPKGCGTFYSALFLCLCLCRCVCLSVCLSLCLIIHTDCNLSKISNRQRTFED